MSTNKDKEFAVIGCGRLGTALSVFLSGSGFKAAAFSSRTQDSAMKTKAHTKSGTVYPSAYDAARSAKLVFITTPDTVIEPVCEQLAGQGGFDSSQIVFHLSGALSSSILVSAKKAGAAIGSIHPLQAFAPYEPGQASPFKGINISIEGDTAAVDMGRQIVSALGASSFTIPTDAKTLYHASAVVASNYLVTLEHFALKLLEQADLSETQAYEILEPLIMGTLKNIKARGSVQALTGPVARGDNEIVSRHLADIDKKLPQFSDLYRKLGQHTLDIADQNPDPAGQVSDKARQALKRLFKS